MATLLLSAAGMALGGSIGGAVLGLSMAAVGRAAGAALGRRIDQQLLGAGSDPVETGRTERFRLTGASEGQPLTMVHGRMRIGGQVIWASHFKEHVHESGGGKGAPPTPAVREYRYSVSLAIALCPGVISCVGRVWADGKEVAPDSLNMRVYEGTETQMPDPIMEATEGPGNVPAYRGLAYVVFEDLDLSPFSNRVPQFSFEVHRAAQPSDAGDADLSRAVQAVALIPGTGEYALATTPVALETGFAETRMMNINTPSGRTDLPTSLDALTGELPRCGSVSLVVSWFGDDLRCGHCRVRPRVEQNEADAQEMPWQVAGRDRRAAGLVPQENDRPIYGGTPSDQSVRGAISDLRGRGLDVVFYPFILMEQMPGNALPDPWSGAPSQAKLPWRGRVTTAIAAGRDGSSDGTAAARAEVDAFFDGPEGFDAFILHYAQLCADAGGIGAFCIGSEMRGLTQIRDDQGYPAVARLRSLAARCRAILGDGCKISYAADWSEYHGHQPRAGDKIFHLDPLWADENIDFVGIDNYMPLSDWRDGTDHLDAGWGHVGNLDYLRANVEGGELFDWYYPSPEARAAQRRVPISDGDGEPWVWRVKDLRGWWSHAHHDRVNGQRSDTPTAWTPGMKPIWFTELGCAAIDRGTNQPNKFLDPKSSESRLPRHSNGQRDDYIQMQYLRALLGYYSDPAHNPLNAETGQRMLDMSRAHVWAWDARPWPAFPVNEALWSDGDNYARGHWLNGRASARPLAEVVREICARAGVEGIDVSALHGVVRGYTHTDTASAREALQPLMLAYGFDAIERDGTLVFRTRHGIATRVLSSDGLAVGEDGSASLERLRAGAAEVSGRVRIGFTDESGSYEARAAEAVLADDRPDGVTGSELPLALISGEAQAIAERWLAESRLARERLRFALPPSGDALGAGDVVHLDGADWRIDRVDSAGLRLLEAVRVDAGLYRGARAKDVRGAQRGFASPAPVTALFMDLPLLRGDEQPHAPHIAMTGRPWPGIAALQSAVEDADYGLVTAITSPATVGETLTDLPAAPAGRWDRGPALRVKLVQGALQSVAPAQILGGANLAAIGDGTPEGWELFQFSGAELVAPRVWDLRLRLRGQAGSDGTMPAVWPKGSRFVLMEPKIGQIALPPASIGVARDYRWGPATRIPGDATWRHARLAFDGIGLRPYPVCHLRAEGQGDHVIRWTRRTRIDGDSWSGPDVPLGEERELYLLRILSGDEVLHETLTQEPHHLIPASLRAGLGLSAGYKVAVAQVSERFGPGPFTSALIG